MALVTLPNASDVQETNSILKDIRSILGSYDDVYGLYWDQSTDSYTRLESASNLTQSDFDNIYPWKGMRRCNVNDSVEVTAYYGESGYAVDGSNGQVMVEIPAFYYKVSKTLNGYTWMISPNAKDGFKRHPAFVRDGADVPFVYIGAYEACIYDTSAGAYLLNDEQVADFGTDLLSSISGAKPCSGLTQSLTIVNSRSLANNRGLRWHQQDFLTTSAIQMLYLVEYADFDSQTTIGRGVVDKASGTGNESEITGATDSFGNSSGMAGTDGLSSITYRGVENFWGNIYQWVDGININDRNPWIADNGFASDTYTGTYTNTGFFLPSVNGYVKDLKLDSTFDYLFLPSDSSGSSGGYVHDYYYQFTGSRVARFGGDWSSSSFTGAFFWLLLYSSADRNRNVGARLLAW